MQSLLAFEMLNKRKKVLALGVYPTAPTKAARKKTIDA
jgi:hypothetical protein